MENNTKNQDKKRRQRNTGYADYLTASIKMVAVIAAGVYSGIYVDSIIPMNFPIMTIFLSLLSVVVAIYILIKV